MAHRKAGGSASNLRDSAGKRLGVKKSDGQRVEAGQILIRQRGTKVLPGTNVARGNDDTLYAKVAGKVKFSNKRKIKFDGNIRNAKVVSVETS